MNKIDELQYIIDNSNKILFFTGAGVSTASGLKDFRSKEGLYHSKYKYSPEKMLSYTFFNNHPEEFYKFYKDKLIYDPEKIHPNYAHYFIAKLEEKGKSIGVVTQNIDGFHKIAKSKMVVELHGSIYRNYCESCHKLYDLEYIRKSDKIPYCSCCGYIKPDVTLYEEALKEKDIIKTIDLMEKADCLIILGTSLTVYPAASFLQYFQGKNIIIINKQATNFDDRANLTIAEDINKVLKEIIIR